MKNMKKLFSLLLALVMVMGLATTAFAADTGTITVENPQKDTTYTAYKIFDVTYDGTGNYSYTINSSSDWYDVVNDYANITLTESAVSGVYVVSKESGFVAANFAATLLQNISGKQGIELETSGSVATKTGLDLGYYLVDSSTGALCNLTTTDPTATIRDKNDVPFEKTLENGSKTDDVKVGDSVTYKITGAIPDTTGYSNYHYIINDTLSAGLTYNGDIALTIGGYSQDELDDLGLSGYYGFTITENEDGTTSIKIRISVHELVVNSEIRPDEFNFAAGDPIVLTYSATVNENAVASYTENEATLMYSNNPEDFQEHTTTPPSIVTLYSYKIQVNKTDASSGEELDGAKFVVKNSENKYYKYTAATETTAAAVSWVDTQDDATVVTTVNGIAEFMVGETGTYYLVETEAPAGYNLLTAPVEVVLATVDPAKDSVTVLTQSVAVPNQSGSVLPSTGGMGTTIFYIAGGMLVLAAVVLLVTKRRMSAEQ